MDINEALDTIILYLPMNSPAVVAEAWQTLKAAVLAQQTTSKQSAPCYQCAEYLRDGGANYCPNCGNKLK